MRFNAAQSIKNLFKPVDLTKGKPYKQLIIFMIPILISYIFQQVYTISDAAIVEKYLSAVRLTPRSMASRTMRSFSSGVRITNLPAIGLAIGLPPFP